jgi:hypothetical protein
MFFGEDRYAAFALGTAQEIGSSFADSDIFVASRGLSESVVPDIDEGVLVVDGENPSEVEAVRKVLLERFSSRELWVEPSLPMELHAYVKQLVQHGEVFIHLYFDRSSPSEPYSLFQTTWLAPETVMHRSRSGGDVYEQFVSRRRFEGAGYVVDGEVEDQLVECPEEEVLHLQWPLDEPEPDKAPAKAALKLGEQVARHSDRTLLAARAGAEPTETFLPLARARAGAFAGALDKQKAASARIKDMLFYPGAYEAEAFPWVDAVTEYFAADRILRSRIAICKIRDYLFEEFNRQVLRRWSALNGWGEVTLALRPELFTQDDWRTMRADLGRGAATLGDVRAAVLAEYESGHQYGRFARAQADVAAQEEESQ